MSFCIIYPYFIALRFCRLELVTSSRNELENRNSTNLSELMVFFTFLFYIASGFYVIWFPLGFENETQYSNRWFPGISKFSSGIYYLVLFLLCTMNRHGYNSHLGRGEGITLNEFVTTGYSGDCGGRKQAECIWDIQFTEKACFNALAVSVCICRYSDKCNV